MRDIGANLTHKKFQGSIAEVITRAKGAGVDFVDVTGTDLSSSETALALARERPDFLGATAGIHPHAAKDMDGPGLLRLRTLLADPCVLMCGEMGLDFARNFSEPAEQHSAFEAQLDLAEEVSKPLFLHCRDAFDEFVSVLDRRPALWSRSIVHCFTGNRSQAEALVERGAWIGITGWVADKRRNAGLLAALPAIPLSRLMIETDAPYLTPLNRPGAQSRDLNEPANLLWVVRALGAALDLDPIEVGAACARNADKLIGRSPIPFQVKDSTHRA